MYAIFENGGKQYLAKKGQIIKLEKLKKEVGDKIEFNKILMIVDNNHINVGKPYVKNSLIQANILNHGKHKKINIIKFKRRKHHQKQQGHRQQFTNVKIKEILNIG